MFTRQSLPNVSPHTKGKFAGNEAIMILERSPKNEPLVREKGGGILSLSKIQERTEKQTIMTQLRSSQYSASEVATDYQQVSKMSKIAEVTHFEQTKPVTISDPK
jgi:hypothetical protein